MYESFANRVGQIGMICNDIRRDERGASVVELAVCCPFLVLLLSGLVDLGQGLAERYALEKAVNLGLEVIQAHPPHIEAGQSDYNYDHVRAETAAAARVPVENVVLSRWTECNGVRQQVASVCLPGQRIARFIEVEVTKLYEPHFVSQKINLEASAVVRIQ